MVPTPQEEAAEGYEFEPQYPYVKSLVGDPPEHKNAYELWRLHDEKRELRKSYLDHWQSTISRTGTGRPVDAIISPAVAHTAVPHGLVTYVQCIWIYYTLNLIIFHQRLVLHHSM